MPEIIADKYEVMETIGRGGMGTVYKARQRNLDRIVAIKMLSEELASDPEFRARFQQEATVVARLNHPNIVQVHDIEHHNNTFCIIMEYVDGENLQAKIDRDVTLPEQEVVAIGAQVSRALAYAHSKGIIHRDIKPDNIHVTPKGVAKVMDFGIARFLDSKLKTQTGISMGTPKFMSPEQVTGKNVDGQTDLYSLGICLYYCLAGRPPFDGENAISVATRHLYEQPEPPSKLNASISPAVEAVILKALEKQKANRYATGIEMAEALEGVLRTKTPVRSGPEVDEAFTGGATQKMPAQTYGGVITTPEPGRTVPATSDEHVVAPTDPSALTPGRNRTVPELDPDFRTPRGDMTSGDPTRNFRLSLMFFGGLVFFAVLLLILLVVWLRQTEDSSRSLQGRTNREISPVERMEAIDAESAALEDSGRVVEARRLWSEFHKKNPDVESDRINQEIALLDAKLPLSESDILTKRREKMGYANLNVGQRALALSYLQAAELLSPDSLVGTTTNTINMLKSQLAAPSPEAVQAAQQNYTSAQQRVEDKQWNEETRKLLITAVESDYTNPRYWKALGDFFLNTDAIDDARVVYGEALKRNPDAPLREAIELELSRINK